MAAEDSWTIAIRELPVSNIPNGRKGGFLMALVHELKNAGMSDDLKTSAADMYDSPCKLFTYWDYLFEEDDHE